MRLYVVILQGPCTLHQWPARECTSCTVCSEHEAPPCGLREHLTVPVQYHAAYRAFESFFVQAQIFHDAIPVQVDPGLSQRDSEKYTFILKIDAAQPVCIYYLCAFVASDAVVDDLFQTFLFTLFRAERVYNDKLFHKIPSPPWYVHRLCTYIVTPVVNVYLLYSV